MPWPDPTPTARQGHLDELGQQRDRIGVFIRQPLRLRRAFGGCQARFGPRHPVAQRADHAVVGQAVSPVPVSAFTQVLGDLVPEGFQRLGLLVFSGLAASNSAGGT
jgi:hypothetical protein